MKKAFILTICILFTQLSFATVTQHWLEGKWTGNGGSYSYFSWTITMEYKAEEKTISLLYPSHGCGGTFNILTIETGKATCMEDLTYNLGSCSTDNYATITAETDGSITIRYYKSKNDAEPYSMAKLKRI